MSAAARIERFLETHPEGNLLIAVGYCTPAGMAWLARRTAGRSVDLIIGDARRRYWSKGSSGDMAACREWLARPDVEVLNWYATGRSRSGRSNAHLKVWAVHDGHGPLGMLVGSGNLTKQGLEQNVEVMVEAHGNDLEQAWADLCDLRNKAWSASDRLLYYLTGDEIGPTARSREASSARQSNGQHGHSRSTQRAVEDRDGCLAQSAAGTAKVTLLTIAAAAVLRSFAGRGKSGR